MALNADLQQRKESLIEFRDLTKSILLYLPAVITSFHDKGQYRININEQSGTRKFVRPMNTELFQTDVAEFDKEFNLLIEIFESLKTGQRDFDDRSHLIIDKVLYTIQQSIGAGLDLFVNPNSARKHVGNRFEELMKSVFTALGIANSKTVLQIPYPAEDGEKVYKCENDLIISPFEEVRSTSKYLDEREIVVSIKTTSKDRMGKIFIDKILLEKFVGHPQKVIGIFLNDVQRKDEDNISYTLVSGLFMVYTNFLTQLEGIYYLDPPPNAKKEPFSQHMKPFSRLITHDVWGLLAT